VGRTTDAQAPRSHRGRPRYRRRHDPGCDRRTGLGSATRSTSASSYRILKRSSPWRAKPGGRLRTTSRLRQSGPRRSGHLCGHGRDGRLDRRPRRRLALGRPSGYVEGRSQRSAAAGPGHGLPAPEAHRRRANAARAPTAERRSPCRARPTTSRRWPSRSSRREGRTGRPATDSRRSSFPACAEHRRIPPRRPQVTGKVERYQQTLKREWALGQVYRSSAHRAAALSHWLAHYNERRPHSSLGGRPPISRVHNAPRQDIY
jgi:transposase InsO family protein